MESQPMMRVKFSGPQQKRLEMLSRQHGLEPLELLSRLVEWFGRADESERREIESHIDKSAHHRRTEYN
jgi:hypothetical protein